MIEKALLTALLILSCIGGVAHLGKETGYTFVLVNKGMTGDFIKTASTRNNGEDDDPVPDYAPDNAAEGSAWTP